ncbi:DUF4148 domain-containing protein [Achromobacter sp. GG226]|uniref:DUF4148 domain-containing protein n=1 Tax=Verticiella alkaliphila TaxID=2779529 RepID=UPI001C0E791B|nr:DUF4148 domain-containing protein [Verticiella sp. GG226]MBU4610326.1 DUF4148 domain-containing protein [Verticiella sp. GG226]
MHRTKKIVLAFLLSATAIGANAQTAGAYQERGLSRAEVVADLQRWKEAGLDKFWRGENTPDMHSAEYRAAYARYLELSRHAAGTTAAPTR